MESIGEAYGKHGESLGRRRSNARERIEARSWEQMHNFPLKSCKFRNKTLSLHRISIYLAYDD